MKAVTQIDGDTAIVRAVPPYTHDRLAALLLEHAGEDRKREVRSTSIGGRGFRVPLDIAEAAGLVSEPAESDAPEKDSAKPARKPTTRSKTTKAADEKADDDKAGDDKAAEGKS